MCEAWDRVEVSRVDEPMRRALYRVEILGKRLPVPFDACGQRSTRYVFHALHQANEKVVLVFLDGREADAAVATDGGGHAMIARWRQMRVPGGLGIIVGVDIDEAGRNGQTVGIDLASALCRDSADVGKAAVVYRYVCAAGLATGPVYDGPTADNNVVHC